MGKPSKKAGYILVIGLMGLLLLILGNVFSSTAKEDPSISKEVPEKMKEQTADETLLNKSKSSSSSVKDIEANYEEDLQELLNKIQGVSKAEVMVNLDSTKVKVFEKNLIQSQQSTKETDTNGGEREIEENSDETEVVLVRQGDKEVPLLVQTKKPDVRGVFVVAKGVNHASVEKWVIEAVSRVLDVPTHRVSVMPKN
ncbi:stage III sporulation protein AG [Lentibacillus cibarius]|uniref:Stage III sporulation protein AG n=2 Tax=Lentibacillus cibarius TaxID=2583219 RepID=A0A549YN40_9BACI|nr:stage III sporulation protein AG [Lentibacillus cibarius]